MRFKTKYGYFSKDGLEYVIIRPDTPRPWINYLTNGLYCALVSQTGGGYSFVEEAGFNRILRERPGDVLLEDRPGRYIYVRDKERGKFWSVNWQPVCKKPSFWEARQGLGYTKIKSINLGIRTELVFFVPQKGSYEVWWLKVKNETSRTRHLSLFTYVEWCLGAYVPDLIDRPFDSFFNIGFFQKNILFATKSRWRRPDTTALPWDKKAFITCNQQVEGFDCLRSAFQGPYHYLQNPQVVLRGRCTNSSGEGEELVGVLQKDLELKAGEEKELVFLLGVVREISEAQKILSYYQEEKSVSEEWKKVCQVWRSYLEKTWVETPDSAFNLSLNIWNKYQCWITSAFSEMDSFYIGGGGVFGFRDECQHIFGVLPQDPLLARDKLLLLLRHQFKDGSVAHNWRVVDNRAIVTEHSDDAQWLVMAILNFLKETGEWSFLEREVEFYDGGKSSVFTHLILALDYTLSHCSPRNLPLHRTADWNDALSGGKLGKGESMKVANMVCWNIRELLPLLEKLGKGKLREKYLGVYRRIKRVLNKECWDGEWYLRATEDDGTPLGSRRCREGKIFLNAQTWPVISGVADKRRGKKAMDAVKKHLDTPFGPCIFLPSFTHLNNALGIISQFVPGTKENGTIFHHPIAWAVIAECILGRGERAYTYWQKTNFVIRGQNPTFYKVEPYVYSEFCFGPENSRFGEGSFSWITGSSAWFYRACLDWILGVRPTFFGLLIDPCIPASWRSFWVKRTFRGGVYNIEVKNPRGVNKGIKRIRVEGKEISGQILPVLTEGEYKIEVEMG